ncbi:hypothetical protein CGLO_00019 [Colletotrichum gloeosporioides Cg-14]|uniref:Uncharacterized protein n=1 Tax=Colletotrichum gloeosporioides (strain Cg-14) TaxID=1237896 RepID=T0MEN8_COLGC|nr:hypothetical protein CGLO_00019 [Colletotrichum gloeosporioides Cg-14]
MPDLKYNSNREEIGS